MLKKMMLDIKNGVESYKKIVSDSSLIMFPVAVVDGVEVFENNKLVRSAGAMFGMAYVDQIDGIKKIVLEDDMPEEVREFILWHELGHIKLGHIDDAMASGENMKLALVKRAFSKKVEKRELEADMYAVEKIGRDKAINGLMYMYEKTMNKECLKRVDALLVKELV